MNHQPHPGDGRGCVYYSSSGVVGEQVTNQATDPGPIGTTWATTSDLSTAHQVQGSSRRLRRWSRHR
jgi:hypothetical protein